VYKARHLLGGAYVAVKRFPENVSTLPLDEKVLDVLLNLRHVNVLRYYHASRTHPMCLMIQYCEAGTLGTLWKGFNESPAESDVAFVMKHIVQGLDALHSHHITHHDIKPDNVLCSRIPDQRDPSAYTMCFKLADFDSARCVSGATAATATSLTCSFGTPLFTAPECFAEPHCCAASADVWSVGIVLLHLADRCTPRAKENPHRLGIVIVNSAPPSFAERGKWSSDMIDFVERGCLVKLPEKRITTNELLVIVFFVLCALLFFLEEMFLPNLLL
jgi:serine/threonine protein kinase